MLHRIQSILLFCIISIMIILFFVPFWSKICIEDHLYTLYAFRFQEIDQQGNITNVFFPYTCIGFCIFITIGLSIAMLYSTKKSIKIQLGMLNACSIAAIIGFTLFFSNKHEEIIIAEFSGKNTVGFVLSVIALFFNFIIHRLFRRVDKRTIVHKN